MAEPPRRRQVASDKEMYDAARRIAKKRARAAQLSGQAQQHGAQADRMQHLAREMMYGASGTYTPAQMRQDLLNVGAQRSTPEDDVLDFEEYPAQEPTQHLGEIKHTPVHGPHTANVNELQESPIADAILLDDESEGTQ